MKTKAHTEETAATCATATMIGKKRKTTATASHPEEAETAAKATQDTEPMTRQPLDTHDAIPPAMRNYISYYGFHFSKHAFDFAVSHMRQLNRTTGKTERIEPWDRDTVSQMLAKHGIVITNDTLYDAAYVANMARSDYLGSSIPDEAHLCLFVKDYLDDPDAADGTAFRRWYATMIGCGTPVDFNDLL